MTIYKISHLVNDSESGRRVDLLLRDLIGISRKEIQRQFANVTINHKPSAQNYQVRTKDMLEATIEVLDQTLIPTKLDLEILYQDQHIIAVNKPSGILTCPSNKNPLEPSVSSSLISKFGELARGSNPLMDGIVHRLDKECSGVLIIARSNIAQEELKNQFARRSVQKKYTAIIHGQFNNKCMTIDKPLAVLKRKWKVKISMDGKESITKVKLIKSGSKYSLVECKPITGRTHQIRVHLLSIGHPILGDKTYHPDCLACKKSRLMLHSTELQFKHPLTGKTIKIASKLPDNFLRS